MLRTADKWSGLQTGCNEVRQTGLIIGTSIRLVRQLEGAVGLWQTTLDQI